MPNIRLEVDGVVLQVFALRDAKRYTPEANSLPRGYRRPREVYSRIQRNRLRVANEDVFDIIDYVNEMNRNRSRKDASKPYRLFWEGAATDFYLTSRTLRAALASRCKVEVIQNKGTFGWQLTFR